MTDTEYHLRITKLLNNLERLEAEHKRLVILVEHLQRKVDEARPHMIALERARRTNETQTIDYNYEVK